MGKRRTPRHQEQSTPALRPHPPALEETGAPKAWRRHLIDDDLGLGEHPPRRAILGARTSAYQRKYRQRFCRAYALFAHVVRLDAEGTECLAPDWAYETPSFDTFERLRYFVMQHSPPGRYHLWVYHAWDRQCRATLGVTTLLIPARASEHKGERKV